MPRIDRPIPKRANELAATYRSKVEVREMTPEEYRKYFGIEPPVRKQRSRKVGRRK